MDIMIQSQIVDTPNDNSNVRFKQNVNNWLVPIEFSFSKNIWFEYFKQMIFFMFFCALRAARILCYRFVSLGNLHWNIFYSFLDYFRFVYFRNGFMVMKLSFALSHGPVVIAVHLHWVIALSRRFVSFHITIERVGNSMPF